MPEAGPDARRRRGEPGPPPTTRTPAERRPRVRPLTSANETGSLTRHFNVRSQPPGRSLSGRIISSPARRARYGSPSSSTAAARIDAGSPGSPCTGAKSSSRGAGQARPRQSTSGSSPAVRSAVSAPASRTSVTPSASTSAAIRRAITVRQPDQRGQHLRQPRGGGVRKRPLQLERSAKRGLLLGQQRSGSVEHLLRSRTRMPWASQSQIRAGSTTSFTHRLGVRGPLGSTQTDGTQRHQYGSSSQAATRLSGASGTPTGGRRSGPANRRQSAVRP